MFYDSTQDTIAVISSAPGEGAIAVVRLSGPEACAIADRVFSQEVHQMPSHTARMGWIRDRHGEIVDQAVCLCFRAPRSFTGEDVVEFQTHGGVLVPRKVLQVLVEAGARVALPGEFSSRAVLNGKIDLAQAEAIQALIGARNELAVKAAHQSLSGKLSQYLHGIMGRLFDLAGILEAWVDFPEEDLEFASFEEVATSLQQITQELADLRQTYRQGQRLVEGMAICLAGVPNAGKSSLLNALLGRERAIVTDIPGTTRDTLESDWRIGGVHVRLIDTAGIRETEERVEAEGIRRTREAMQQADLIVLVADATRVNDPQQRELFAQVPPDRTVVVWNKLDLLQEHAPDPGQIAGGQMPWVGVSTKTGYGLDRLQHLLEEKVWSGSAPSADALVLTQERHVEAIDRALHAFQAVSSGLLAGVSAEYVALEMRSGLEALTSITGQHLTESVLSAIFSRFCLGK
jgi:tRNA modification GTPase